MRHADVFRRVWVGWLSLVLMGSTVVVAPSVAEVPGLSARPAWAAGLVPPPPRGTSPLPALPAAVNAAVAESAGVPAPKVRAPEPGSRLVTLAGRGWPVALTGGGEVVLVPGTDAWEGGRVTVTVYDRAAARRAGVTGLMLALDGAWAVSGEGSMVALPARLVVDYSGFAGTFGGGYADRLSVVALPACVLAVPIPDGCGVGGVSLPATNDRRAARLIVEVGDLAALVAEPAGGPAGGPAVLAVTSDMAGETGAFNESPLSMSSTWSVAPGSGEFAWSYPIETPSPPAGSAPQVAVGYSSGAVDGLVSTRNTQAGAMGTGVAEFADAFVERSYKSCWADGNQLSTSDLCWWGENAVLSLNGRVSALLPVDGSFTTWRLQDDPGWLVRRDGQVPNDTWVVVTPDGTEYHFGWTTLSWDEGGVRRTFPTGARWTVPVFGDDAGEPCRKPDNTPDMCQAAWRMNLVLKREPTGVETRYLYHEEINHYRPLNGCCGVDVSTPYTRAGYLARIDYGILGPYAPPTARMHFFSEYRCHLLNASCPTELRWQNSSLFPDVPGDLLCADGEPCPRTAPSFFAGKRYSGIRTDVFTDGQWRVVDQVNLYHQFLQNDDGDQKLYLRTLQRNGFTSGQWLLLPPVDLQYVQLPNLVTADPDGNRMGHFRVGTIRDEYGHETRLTYGQPNPCPSGYAGPWYNNTKDCFGVGFGDTLRVFNKYLVTRVDGVDTTGGSPTVTTTYAYEGAPAWHVEHTIWLGGGMRRLPSSTCTCWREWRGYGKTMVTSGSSRTRLQVFRGMHNDRIPSGRRSVSLTAAVDGRTFVDEAWLVGRLLEEETFSAGGGRLTTVVHEYTSRVTAQPTTEPLDWAAWAAASATTRGSLKDAVAGTYAQTRTRSTYNAHLQPDTLLEEGWLDQSGDERCTRTTYAENPAKWMFGYPASVQLVAGDCTATTELTYRETYFDGSTTLRASPSRGLATMVRAKIDDATFATTATTYDGAGRPQVVTDPLNRRTTAEYESAPAGEYPNWSAVTNHLGHRVTTEWLPDRGVPLRVTDGNNRVTSYQYDGFGRLVKQWSPTEQGGAPTAEMAYQIAPNKDAPPYTQTRRLYGANPDRFADTWVVYDSKLRERQTQQHSTDAGKLVVTDTSYDNRGLVASKGMPQAVAVTAGRLGQASWDNSVSTGYDELGRIRREAAMRRGIEHAATTTSYTHNTVTVTPPVGGAKRTTTDGLGRTSAVEEHDGTAWRGSVHFYDLADNLNTLLDPAWNVTRHTYDKAGRRLSTDDPDAGLWSYRYDLAGNRTHVTDAAGATVVTVYDALNRTKERRQTGPTGPLLARWSYDAPGELGLLNASTRVTADGDWTIDITGHDARNRPLGTTWIVPAGVPGLSRAYTIRYGYDPADHVASITYPAVGGLPQETVTTGYNNLGLPDQMTGLDQYVWAATYDDRGRPSTMGLGPRPGGQTWMARSISYGPDQRPSRIESVAGATTTAHQFTYNTIGAITERTTQIGGQDWRECFSYDNRRRLVAARTVDLASGCATTTPDGGDQPYRHTYSYSVDGNLEQRVENGVTSTYTYPAVQADRRHAPTTVVTGPVTDTYTWGANGELRARTVNGKADTLTWDPERRLASIAGSTGTSRFVYDPAGERLLHAGPASRTLYLPGHEINASPDGSTVRAVRTYTFNGQLIATRSPSGTDFVAADQQGSTEATFASGGAMEASRSYNPYGERRAGGEFDTDRGWLGQVEDDTNRLSYLHARYYDPNIATFISPDPVQDLEEPKSLNPYSYALNNPVMNTDPSGLCSTKKCVKEQKAAAAARAAVALMMAAAAAIRGVVAAARGAVRGAVAAVRLSVTALARAVGTMARAVHHLAHSAARSAGNRTLVEMCKVNCDPKFWYALTAAYNAPRENEGMVLLSSSPAPSRPEQDDCERDWWSTDCFLDATTAGGQLVIADTAARWELAADLAGGERRDCGEANCVDGSWLIVPWAEAGTLGGTIVCRDTCTTSCTAHEQVHVGQYNDDGVRFVAGYIWESFFGGYGRDNKHEGPAYAAGDC